MGMDVCGKAPTTKEGDYFRNNAWAWRPLADYVIETAPEIAAKCKYWHSNDGDGLNGADSIALADRLQAEIDSGRTAQVERIFKAAQEAMPNEPCRICAATGTRPPVGVGAGDPLNGGKLCNGCDGQGYVRPMKTWYFFTVKNVQDFTTFLRSCGGFEID